MKASLIVAAVTAAVLVAGCGAQHVQSTAPVVKTVSPSKTERE